MAGRSLEGVDYIAVPLGVLFRDDDGNVEDGCGAHHGRADVHAVREAVDDAAEALLHVADEHDGFGWI